MEVHQERAARSTPQLSPTVSRIDASAHVLPARAPPSGAEQLQAVERTLQDQRGGDLVNHLRRGACATRRPRAATRSAAAVVRRSSQSRIGSGVSLPRLRANARVAWTRGPCEPSRLNGSPITKPPTPCSAASASRRSASAAEARARQGGEARGDAAGDVGQGEPQRLGAEVDADQPGAPAGEPRQTPRRGLHDRSLAVTVGRHAIQCPDSEVRLGSMLGWERTRNHKGH